MMDICTELDIETDKDYAGMYENIRDFFAGGAVSLPPGYGVTILMNKGVYEWLKIVSADVGQTAVHKTENNITQVSEIVRLFTNLITRSR